MRLLVCAKNDLAANLAVNQLLRGLRGCEVSIWLSDIDRPAELADPDLGTLRFFERQLPKNVLWPLLDDRRDQRAGRCVSYAELARHFDGECVIVDSFRRTEWRDRLADLAPDLVISIRFSHIFPPSLLAVPRHGVLNLHPGDLPRYAGLFAPFHQIVDGQARLGCTLHWVDQGIDTGPVVGRRFLAVESDRSLIWHICRVYPLGIELALEVIEGLRAGRRPSGEAQQIEGRRYHRLPSAEAFARFREAGRKLVDFADYEELLSAYRAWPEEPSSAIQARAG
jgi:methionyl-tRNA formyltransferase